MSDHLYIPNYKYEESVAFGSNQCFVCLNYFRHSRVYKKTIYPKCVEINFRVSHPECVKAIRAVERCKSRLLDAEFNLFCLKSV